LFCRLKIKESDKGIWSPDKYLFEAYKLKEYIFSLFR